MRTRTFSSVDEILLPRAADGTFERLASGGYGPAEAAWTFSDAPNFDSDNVGGAQRLSNGNTLVCEGASGRLFEVTAEGVVVWNYQVPIGRTGPLRQGSTEMSSLVFRAYRYDAGYPGLAGRDLSPHDPIELP